MRGEHQPRRPSPAAPHPGPRQLLTHHNLDSAGLGWGPLSPASPWLRGAQCGVCDADCASKKVQGAVWAAWGILRGAQCPGVLITPCELHSRG